MSPARIHSPVAFIYAEALFNLAKRQGDLSRLDQEAQTLAEIGRQAGSRFGVFLKGPQIPTEDKVALIEKAIRGRVDDLFVNLYDMLIRRDRVEWVEDILEVFSDMVAAEQGIERGVVTTAVGLSPEQQSAMAAALEGYTGKQLEIDYQVDAGLVGGVVFQYRDQLIDQSVRGRLKQLSNRLQAVRLTR